ncbi:hypothetical protein [Acetobacter nitrogenifigens]|uniref:hypothetical protein n=1 Tax=Acetobacter nitrogenifigens TaxID=285268 RepID=UPI00047DF1E5|nr:hypothetical protein [Acetobacter nitrogenifigens]
MSETADHSGFHTSNRPVPSTPAFSKGRDGRRSTPAYSFRHHHDPKALFMLAEEAYRIQALRY